MVGLVSYCFPYGLVYCLIGFVCWFGDSSLWFCYFVFWWLLWLLVQCFLDLQVLGVLICL